MSRIVRVVLGTSSWAIVVVAATVAAAGSLKGKVRDLGKKPPSDGLGGATVNLDGAKPPRPELTNQQGEYIFAQVEKGDYNVVATKKGRSNLPKPVTVNDDPTPTNAPDIELLLTGEPRAYYQTAGSNLAVEFMNVPEKQRRDLVTDRWNELRETFLPPSSKAVLVQELVKTAPDLTKALPEDAAPYLSADWANIDGAQELFGEAIAGKASVPSKESVDKLNLDPTIVGDIVFCIRNGSSAPKEQKKAFSDNFERTWENTDVLVRVKKLGKTHEKWESQQSANNRFNH